MDRGDRRALTVLCVGVVVVTTGVLALRHARTSAREELATATTRLSDCLVGDAPTIDDGTRAVMRELPLSLSSDSAWPRRCADYASALAEPVLRGRRVGVIVGEIPIAEASRDLASGNPEHALDLLRALDAFRRGPHDTSVPHAPATAPLLAANRFAVLPDLRLRQSASRGARFGAYVGSAASPDGQICCELGADMTLRCVERTGKQLWCSQGDIGTPQLFVQSYGDFERLIDEHESVVLDGGRPTGYVSHARTLDGGRAAMLVQGRTSHLVMRSRDGRLDDAEIATRELTGASLVGSFLVWPEPYKPTMVPVQFRARAVDDPRAAIIDVGTAEMGGWASDDHGCEADTLFFDFEPSVIARDKAGVWRTLRPVGFGPRSQTSCRDDQLSIMDWDENGVTRQDCTVKDGCSSVTARFAVPRGSKWIATRHDVVGVWPNKAADSLYVVRAPIAGLTNAAPRLLVDSRFGDTLSLLFATLVAVGDDVAAIFHDRDLSKAHGVVLRANGSATPLTN